jgi:hypothetical protein
MNALVQIKASRFAQFRAIEAQFKSIEVPSRLLATEVQAVRAHELHEFPESSTSRVLPLIIRDEMLEFYAFIFCQGDFRQLGMTFEQFLLVVAAIKPADFPATLAEARTL